MTAVIGDSSTRGYTHLTSHLPTEWKHASAAGTAERAMSHNVSAFLVMRDGDESIWCLLDADRSTRIHSWNWVQQTE